MDHFLDLNLSFLGWPHTAACIVAMVTFFPVMFTRKGGLTHRSWGRAYAIAYALACGTSLGIYRLNKFFFPHWLAIGGLVVLAAGYLAVRFKPRGWKYIHLTSMLLSASNLFGGAINEVFLRIRPLRAMAGDNILASPIVGIAQSIVGQIFLILIVVYIAVTAARSPRRARRPATEESLP